MDKVRKEKRAVEEIKLAAAFIMEAIQQESDKLEKSIGMPSPFYVCILSSIIFESTLKAALYNKLPTRIQEKIIATIIQLLKKAS